MLFTLALTFWPVSSLSDKLLLFSSNSAKLSSCSTILPTSQVFSDSPDSLSEKESFLIFSLDIIYNLFFSVFFPLNPCTDQNQRQIILIQFFNFSSDFVTTLFIVT